jgi:hypothetical protein
MKKHFTIITLLALTCLSSVLAQTNCLLAYYPFNGNANDLSGNGYNGTVHGATLATDRFGNANSSYNFTDNINYIQVDNFPVLNTVFTYCAWIKPSSAVGGMNFGCYGTAGAGVSSWDVGYYINNQLSVFDSYNLAFTDTVALANNWHFVSIVYNGSIRIIYVDGQFKKSQNVVTPFYTNLTDFFRIGMHTNGYGIQQFIGEIDDIRVFNCALTQSEIDSLYHEVNTNDGLVAYYPFNGNTDDESGNGNNCTAYGGATLTPDRFGNINRAYRFQNSGDKLRSVVGQILSCTTLSISAWFYRTDDGTENPRIVAVGPNASHIQYYSLIIDRNNDTKLGFYCTDGISALTITPYPTSDSSINSGSWYHGVVVYDGTSVKFFVNDVLDKTVSVSGNLQLFTSAVLQIGSSDDGLDQFLGYIDDIRIYNRPLTDIEIQQLYHEGGWVGISSNSSPACNIKLYPNPATDKINMIFEQTMPVQKSSISIYTTQGQLILQQPIHQAKTEIDIRSLAKGVYILKVENSIGGAVKKIIKE